MNLDKIKKQWDYYCKETDENDFVDVDLHYSMAMEVGGLIREAERLRDELKNSVKIIHKGKMPVPSERD